MPLNDVEHIILESLGDSPDNSHGLSTLLGDEHADDDILEILIDLKSHGFVAVWDPCHVPRKPTIWTYWAPTIKGLKSVGVEAETALLT